MALPPNWARYTTEDGKEYFHNATTNITQWERPAEADGEVYEYKPTNSDLELQERFSEAADGRSLGATDLGNTSTAAPNASPTGGKVSLHSAEQVSLRAAPDGVVSGNSTSTTAAASSTGGGGGGLGNGFVGSFITAASSEEGATGMLGSALTFAQQFFEVSSDDVLKRLQLALLPCRGVPMNSSDFRARPDFWGPFWVSTTAVLFMAASGNFSQFARVPKDSFKADYGLVSSAAFMLYGCLVGVPLVTRLGLSLAGYEVDTVNFRQMICVYGYSLTSLIPVSLVCLFASALIRWMTILVGVGISMGFIHQHLLTDISTEAPSLKWKLLGLFSAVQGTVFLIYGKLFFKV